MMADRSWLILAIPGWFVGLVMALLIHELGLNAFLSSPVGIQLPLIFIGWGVVIPVIAWKYR